MRDEAKIKSIQKETKNIFPLKIFTLLLIEFHFIDDIMHLRFICLP